MSATAADKRAHFTSNLKRKIGLLEQKTGRSLHGLPVVLSGMVTSSIGWSELPYTPLPVDLRSPDLQMEMMEADHDFEHPVLLVSGVRSDDDVMRGEEMELLGLHHLLKHRKSSGEAKGSDGITLYLLPGTHSKHLVVKRDQLIRFRTFMTGELFHLIATESLIRHSVKPPASLPTAPQANADLRDNSPPPPFLVGVHAALEGNLLNRLFTLRARDLLYQTAAEENTDYLSGLLIGAELRELKQPGTESEEKASDGEVISESEEKAPDAHTISEVVVSGSPALRSRYAAALEALGISCTLPSRLDNPVVTGHCQILNHLERGTDR